MPSAELVLSGELQDARLARRFVSERLAGWGAGHHVDSASLLVSELVANVALHAHTEINLKLRLAAGTLRMEVKDSSPRQPMLRHYAADASTGRGLALVVALAQRWGVEPAKPGKTVWVELDAGRPPARAQGAADRIAGEAGAGLESSAHPVPGQASLGTRALHPQGAGCR